MKDSAAVSLIDVVGGGCDYYIVYNNDKPVAPDEPTPDEITPDEATPDEIAVYILGDADGNGKVDVRDVTQLQKSLAGLTELDDIGELAADVDGNGKVDVRDATAIQKWIADIEVSFLVGTQITK